MRRRRFYVAFALTALLLAGVVSYFASSSPDGLERVATDHGMADAEREHPLADTPLADYGLAGIDNGLLSGGLAGVAGVGVVLLLTAGVVFAVRRPSRAAARAGAAARPDGR
jgi:PDGLE domain